MGKAIDKESYSYYKISFRANLKYREKKGLDTDNYKMLSKSDFEANKEYGLNTKEIVYNQFHTYSKETISAIKEQFKREGIKMYSVELQARQFNAESITEVYNDLRAHGYSASGAAEQIAFMYFGSE